MHACEVVGEWIFPPGHYMYNTGHDSGSQEYAGGRAAGESSISVECCSVDLDDVVRDGLSCKRHRPGGGRCAAPRNDRHVGDNPFRRFRQFCGIVQPNFRALRLWSQSYSRGVGSGPRRWSRRKAHSDRVDAGLSTGADWGVAVHTGPVPEPCGIEEESTAQEGRDCETWE